MADRRTARLDLACERYLGPVTVVADRSWPLGDNQVAEVRDQDGRAWIVKIVDEPATYQQELHALRHWAPALGGAAPELHAADEDLGLLIMTRVAGQPAEDSDAEHDPAVHEQAGRLIRLLHNAEPARTDNDLAAVTARKLADWIGRGRHLLSDDEITIARDLVRPLAAVGPVRTVPTHMDNQPRNWLVDDRGRVSLIDFGRCRWDVWIRDTGRLYFQQWEDRPDLRDAYYRGYGRAPDESDLAMLRCYLAYSGLSTVVWASEHDDPEFEAHGHRILAELTSANTADKPSGS